jgi:hypothetical protein
MVSHIQERVFGAALSLPFAISRIADAALLTMTWDHHQHSRAIRYVLYLGTAPGVYTKADDVRYFAVDGYGSSICDERAVIGDIR